MTLTPEQQRREELFSELEGRVNQVRGEKVTMPAADVRGLVAIAREALDQLEQAREQSRRRAELLEIAHNENVDAQARERGLREALERIAKSSMQTKWRGEMRAIAREALAVQDTATATAVAPKEGSNA